MPLITRGIVIASTVVAALVESYLSTQYAPPVYFISIIGFFVFALLGSRLRRIGLPLLMALMYLMPAIYLLFQDAEDFGLEIIWILPLIGWCLSGSGAWQWSLPRKWQWPLITWSMIVAITWPIVFLREADFNLWILPLPRVSNTSIGISPWDVGKNVAYFVIGHNAGILFIDALCRWYANARDAFRRDVLLPQLVAAAIASLVAFYQGFVDLSFLNHHFWTYMIRAAGTLGDPNKLGAVCGFWTVGAIVYAQRLSRPWSRVVTVLGLVLGVAATWLCGSRTGLAAVTISLLIAAFETLRASKLDLRTLAGTAAIALLGAIALAFVLNHASTHTVIQRGTWTYIPFYGDKSIKESANELLWERFGYGPAAIEMVKEHPIEGVGAGMFHTLSHDFGEVAGHTIPQPDNAQAWWRHNLAELGVIGFLPLLIWCVIFGKELFSSAHTDDAASRGMLRGVLIAFFIESLFGMPSQSVAIVMTFWTFVFWTGLQANGLAGQQDRPTGHQANRVIVIATITLIAVHAGATTVNAFGDLRPRERAQRFNWYYRYGYHINDGDGYDREPDPGGNPIMRRWTMKESLAVIPVKGRILKFVAWVDHPDVDTRPVRTQIWADSKLVFEGDLRRSPLFLDIPATPGKTHMVIETAVDRTFRPSDAGNSTDRRDLGLSIRDWTWE